jgi:hypothetical protein
MARTTGAKVTQCGQVGVHLIKAIDLAAASRRQTRYYLRRYELSHDSGYVISKLSGSDGQEKAAEEWYCPKPLLADIAVTDRQNSRWHEESPWKRGL